ncbi:FMN-dependent NADH-azoreductase [Methylobacterium gnaphalii]|uniref:FMN dependent NADH:quinone oxidoreductase n=1 Tax=Methylobacterium gnaphalii TaxID=1010610 RepID=A0A512JE94_9HYPH|nr:NAD(P)H-dependent oxidoreductase [Methylobacterium gnaphalii]GEP08264.1 FMN-dependent NADH-azoreductase 2 [Methylobacterium gnaphalii]GJD67960.1 FMN-dependent NADH-azoreductase 1 [Methylobacterium gnaphalii]GLS51105.1 FMN-dependent NADH-azoreductase 2 [Methylobacterium gnaphalii]
MKLLHIDSSILGAGSVSRELSALVVARLTKGGQAEVIYRDLAIDDLPHLLPATLPSAHPLSAAAGPLEGAAQATRATSDRILEEFLAADTVVIGVPVYNFSIPSQLKAWIDRIVVPGKTFRYGESGAEGLASGKRVIVALTRGTLFGTEAARASAEHAESYLRTVLGFIGITDPEFVLAEGLATGEPNKAKGLATARDAIDQIAA